MVAAIRGPEMKVLLGGAGMEILANSPEEARDSHRRELALVSRLMRQRGIEPK
jgi:hypothetical protein